jgi:hypothetical protein
MDDTHERRRSMRRRPLPSGEASVSALCAETLEVRDDAQRPAALVPIAHHSVAVAAIPAA